MHSIINQKTNDINHLKQVIKQLVSQMEIMMLLISKTQSPHAILMPTIVCDSRITRTNE